MIAVVTGMIATYPVGGVFWDYAQYAIGLERLGFDVYYLEDTGWQTYDPVQGVYGTDCSYGVDFLKSTLGKYSPALGKRWCFRSMEGKNYGLSASEIESVVAGADLFLNVSGSALLRKEYMPSHRKVLIDTDPGWNHFVNYPKWDRQPGWQGAHSYREHDFFFTYAEGIGTAGCLLPSLDLAWQKTRPLVLVDGWRPQPPAKNWTTVMTWKNFQETIEYQGKVYGTKEMEFVRVESLPEKVKASFEMAVGGAQAPREKWQSLGWSVIDSHQISKTAEDYRVYIQSSKGEFSVAKNVYVATRSGWFSCRSVCYLAAGRPVVVQDTGFSSVIPSGDGLIAFNTLEEAAAGIESMEKNYKHHQEAAKDLAFRYFSSEVVLSDLLEKIGL